MLSVTSFALWHESLGTQHASLAFSPDCTHLYVSEHSSDTRALDVASGNELHIFNPDGEIGTACLAVHPSGRILAGLYGSGHVKIWDLNTWTVKRTLDARTKSGGSINYSRDGELIRLIGFDGVTSSWSLDSGNFLGSTDHGYGEVSEVVLSSDGRVAAIAGEEGPIRLWDMDGNTLMHNLEQSRGDRTAMALGPDGRLLVASIDETIRIWDMESGALNVSRYVQDWAFGIAFHPSREVVAFAFGADDVQIWDTRTWEKLSVLVGPVGRPASVRFCADGTYLAATGWDPGQNLVVWRIEITAHAGT